MVTDTETPSEPTVPERSDENPIGTQTRVPDEGATDGRATDADDSPADRYGIGEPGRTAIVPYTRVHQ